MIKTRPTTTLFMLMSVDGKISTGDSNERDVDKDFPKIEGVEDLIEDILIIDKKYGY